MSSFEQAEAYLASRDLEAALTSYRALEAGCSDPDRLSGGRWMCHMLAGNYASAWSESDAIRGRGAPDVHRFWQGEPIDGKRVMVRCLRGYGDTVMYLRWLPELRMRCSEVTVQASPEMLPLLGLISGEQRVVSWDVPGQNTWNQWDVQVEAAELPYVFRATVSTLPSPANFIFPEMKLHNVRNCLGTRIKPRVGVVWTGSNYDPARSIPFQQLKTMLGSQAFEFWSLQAPENNEEWESDMQKRGWNKRVFYSSDRTHAGIADMAAFASEMDLVITIDTMAAHIAGSLGLPTWLLLKREADWRWMLDRDDTPWYPAMTLFRQTSSGDWSGVLQRVCDRLRDWSEEHRA